MPAPRVAFLLALLAGCTAPRPSAAPPDDRVEVASLGALTRAPTVDEIERLGLPVVVCARGQVVESVDEAGAAARAGIAAGDVLLRLDGNDLYSQDDLADFLATSAAGRIVAARVARGGPGQETTIAVALGAARIPAPAGPRLAWHFAGLGQLDAALASARRRGRRVLVGLSGAET